jgi:hypothetical protein
MLDSKINPTKHGPQQVMRAISLLIFLLMAMDSYSQLQPSAIALHPENPHYFTYKGKPTILITSAEHYGAVLNLDFNFLPYLDELQAKGLNLTRTFSGAYMEPTGAFNISKNVMSPASNRFICPWARSNESGALHGGNKWDLNSWDAAYFERLKRFVSEAEKRGIIVELALFCPFYKDGQWHFSPMNIANNVNNVGDMERESVYTLDKSGGLLAVHENMVKKIVQELRGFTNVIFEICNEPYFGGVTMEWQHHIADVIRDAESTTPGIRHLISQNIANDSALIIHPHPSVSVFNFHYASPPAAIKQNYHLNKVIGNNETGFRGQHDSTYRREGWEFILAGGALYNNLDYSFTVGHESGDYEYPEKQPGGGSATLRQQLNYLQQFISRFDFIDMKPDVSYLLSLPDGARAYGMTEPGRQYAAYFLHLTGNLSFRIPAGNYSVEWFDPVSGKAIEHFTLKSSGKGKITLKVPPSDLDLALRMVRTES